MQAAADQRWRARDGKRCREGREREKQEKIITASREFGRNYAKGSKRFCLIFNDYDL